jgi:YegS/Rv2252/BmrU family lipid kinase
VEGSSRHLLLVNPAAGGGRVGRILPEVEAALRERGLEFRTVLTTGLEHGCAQARAAAQEGVVPVVMSGDGLIGQIGGALAEGDVPMGIIPGGRGNDLARVLGIPSDLAGATAVLATGETRAIDVGEANGKRFLGIASCGFDSDANRIANEARLVKGQAVYLYAALRALAAWRPAHFTVTLDGEAHEVVGYGVAAANNKAYGGGMYVAPDAELDDGLLDVVWMSRSSKRRFLVRTLPRVFDGRHVEDDKVTVLRAREARIESDRPFVVYADGDPLTETPVTVRLLPRALRVIAPPAAS